MYIPSSTVQVLANLPDSIDKIEVKALTTPDNDLARKASKNPNALTQDEWETWYCTAYPSSIAYQIEEVIPGSVAKQVRQVAALQGDVLQKTQAVMVLMTVLSLVAAAIAVANLMAASIGERGSELALLKAIGATDGAVSRLMLAETAVISLVGAIVGALLGSGVAQIVGHVVFGSGITMRPMVFVLVFVLLTLTVLIASFSSIRSILGLKPGGGLAWAVDFNLGSVNSAAAAASVTNSALCCSSRRCCMAADVNLSSVNSAAAAASVTNGTLCCSSAEVLHGR